MINLIDCPAVLGPLAAFRVFFHFLISRAYEYIAKFVPQTRSPSPIPQIFFPEGDIPIHSINYVLEDQKVIRNREDLGSVVGHGLHDSRFPCLFGYLSAPAACVENLRSHHSVTSFFCVWPSSSNYPVFPTGASPASAALGCPLLVHDSEILTVSGQISAELRYFSYT